MNVGINSFVPISLLTVLCIVTSVYGVHCIDQIIVFTKPPTETPANVCFNSNGSCFTANCTFGPTRVMYQSCFTEQENCAQMAKKCEVIRPELGIGKLGGCRECQRHFCTEEELELPSQPQVIPTSTENPINMTTASLKNTEKPINMTTASLKSTEKPINMTTESLKNTEKPIEMTTESLKDTENPIEMTTASLKDTENPIEMATESLKDTEKPIEMTTAPDTVKPTKMSTASVAVTKPTTHQYAQVTNKKATKSATTDKYLWGIEFGV